MWNQQLLATFPVPLLINYVLHSIRFGNLGRISVEPLGLCSLGTDVTACVNIEHQIYAECLLLHWKARLSVDMLAVIAPAIFTNATNHEAISMCFCCYCNAGLEVWPHRAAPRRAVAGRYATLHGAMQRFTARRGVPINLFLVTSLKGRYNIGYYQINTLLA